MAEKNPLNTRNLTFQEAVKEGLAFDILGPEYKKDTQLIQSNAYGKLIGGWEVARQNQIKSEDFWQSTFDAFTSRFPSTAAKKTTEALKTQTEAIKAASGRESGTRQAVAKRVARATSGLLASGQAPIGNGNVGPMLGGDSMLGEESKLGTRRRV